MNELLDALKAPFPESQISWRVGAMTKDQSKGIALAYLDASDVMRRLDEVMGIDWQDYLMVFRAMAVRLRSTHQAMPR